MDESLEREGYEASNVGNDCEPDKEVYLGDGLYASFDGYNVILRAPRAGGDHWVGLEPSVIREFMRYLRGLGNDPSMQP